MEREPIQVTIVTANAETLDGLQAYLSLAGLAARGTRRLAEAGSAACSALVLFPDEFLLKEVLRELERLRRDKPDVLSLVVTRDPDRYLTVTDVKGNGHVRIVIPKPAWGWTILDAIRAGLESPSELGGPCEQ